jgi:hypothetical protein
MAHTSTERAILIALAVLFLFIRNNNLQAGYTTPNTGVIWTLDSLVLRSGGTLTGSFPNYVLTDTATISPNDRLDVLAGSIVSVSQGAGKGITVQGILRAVGTPTDSIIIQGQVASMGSHRGVRFEDSSVDSLCIISYCRIQDAVEAIYCLDSSPTIIYSFFTNNSSNGIRCFRASPIVRYCTFTENRQSAITANLSSSPTIEYCTFTDNNFQNTSARNQIAIGGQGINNPVIRYNVITNQNYYRAGGISLLNIESTGGCAAIVEGNSITSNSFGILVQGPNMTPLIRSNRIENNRINPDPMVSGSGITIQTGGSSNTPIITGNFIKENYWGVTIVSATGLTQSPQPNLGNLSNADTSDDGWNIFINNNNGGAIYQLYNNGTQDVFAQNNFWGSTDSATVESWITHRPDSAVFGLVNYLPFGIPGLGTPDSFTIRQRGGTMVELRWSFPQHSPLARVNILSGASPSTLVLAATLPDTQGRYAMTAPFGIAWFYGLSSSNRFGEGDTLVRSFTVSDTTPPAMPTGFTIAGAYVPPLTFRLTWQRNTDLDLAGYRIYRRIADTTMPMLYALAAKTDTVYSDTSVGCDTFYYYWLSAVDTAGNESPNTRRSFVYPCPQSVRGATGVPQDYTLQQNYPNPFNPVTSIAYAIPREQYVLLKIYNLIGRAVAVLVDKVQQPGYYSAVWNAEGFSSGVYFCKLTAGEMTRMCKLVLVR